MLRFVVCVGVANANSDEAVSLLQLNAQAVELPAGVEQDQTDTYWACDRKGVTNEDGFGHSSLEMCAGVVRSDPDCITGQFDYNRKYKGQCKCVIKSTTGTCDVKEPFAGYITYTVTPSTGVPAGVLFKNSDRYWGCPRKGVRNQHGFGYKNVADCAKAVMQDAECVTGQFDYNRGYNGQCKCVTKEPCVKVKGLRGYTTFVLDPAPNRAPAGVTKYHTDRYWGCTRKGIANQHGFGHKDLEDCANGVKNDPDCVSGQFDFNQAYNGQCKCVTTGGDSFTACNTAKGLKNYNTYRVSPTVAVPAGVVLKNTDRYWGCRRKGIDSKHGFGFKSVEACADGVKTSAFCTTGQFDYNRKYNGQCKCVTGTDDCLSVKGLRGYNTYQIEPWEAKPVPTTTRHHKKTTTTTTICNAGAVDDSDICNHKTCVDDGSAWMTAHEDCPQDVGEACPEGEVYVAVEGECCKKCMFKPCETEGDEGTDECPAGCVHVNDEDECKLAAAAWPKATFDDGPIPEGSIRPTGCFRNKKYLIKFNTGETGGYQNKWPICKQR